MRPRNGVVLCVLFVGCLILPTQPMGQAQGAKESPNQRDCSLKSQNGLYHFYVQADLGPFGKALVPELVGTQSTSQHSILDYRFPSVYFTISVTRAIAAKTSGNGIKEDTDFENWHRSTMDRDHFHFDGSERKTKRKQDQDPAAHSRRHKSCSVGQTTSGRTE